MADLAAAVARRAGRLEYILAAIVGLGHAWVTFTLGWGDFFNSYPYMSNDSFDWVAQGVAFNERLAGVDVSPWPVLRNPVFVLVTALDDALRASGAVIALANGAAVALTLGSLGWLARRLGYGGAAIAAVVLACYFSTLGFWRLWILSDTICTGLMTASFCLLIAHVLNPARRLIYPAAALAIAAGLTQTYGIIGFCGMVATIIALRLVTRRPVGRAAPLTLVGVIAVTFGAQKLWAAAIPHGMVPEQFSLLKLNFEMADHYLNIWTTAFGVFAPLVIAAVIMRARRRLWPRLYEIALVATLLAFVALAFFYQWKESRFTFMYLSVFFAVLLMVCRPPVGAAAQGSTVEGKLVWSCAISVAIGLLVVPGDYWSPKLMGARIDWNHTWVGEATHIPPVDRFDLAHRCPTLAALCPAATAPPQSDAYRQNMFDQYKRRTANDPR